MRARADLLRGLRVHENVLQQFLVHQVALPCDAHFELSAVQSSGIDFKSSEGDMTMRQMASRHKNTSECRAQISSQRRRTQKSVSDTR